jgi:RNA polymerase sigma factor for flagellar operon FliA
VENITEDATARDELTTRHLRLVYLAARRMASRGDGAVDEDELISAGTLGLLQAAERFDPSRGLAFSTFAMQRIHGAMLDELRGRDMYSRPLRARSRELARAVSQLSGSLQRLPTPAEIAEAMGIPLRDYWSLRDALHHSRVMPLEVDVGGRRRTLDAADESPAPDAGLEHDSREWEVQRALEGLAPMDRLVLALSFYENLTLGQIGKVLRVTESRVCQIRRRALAHLREHPSLAAA